MTAPPCISPGTSYALRGEIADAIREYCHSVSPAAVQMSGEIERIYYAGISLDGLTDAIFAALGAGPAQACANPIAWVIPGDDNAKDSGFIDAMAWQQGEFTRPLYAAPPAAAQNSGRSWDMRLADRVQQLANAGCESLTILQVYGLIAFVRDGEGSDQLAPSTTRGHQLAEDCICTPDERASCPACIQPSTDCAIDIPEGVYFSAEASNFYHVETKRGCGNDFYRIWKDHWRAFPQSEAAVSSKVHCQHRRTTDGPRVDLRWGTGPTEVCDDCGMWRTTHHKPGVWQEGPVSLQVRGDK